MKSETVLTELKKLLQAGYKLQEDKNSYQVHRVPRYWESGFTRESFSDYLRFGANGHIDFTTYTRSIKSTLENFDLNFTKFKSRTETINPKIDTDSPAGLLTRQIHELENITEKPDIFELYKIIKSHEAIKYINGVIQKGFDSHTFRDNKHRDLMNILWQNRRIETPEGKLLKKGKEVEKDKIYKTLKINHERFKGLVRAINIPMKRKGISLKVNYPKNVQILVKQDSM